MAPDAPPPTYNDNGRLMHEWLVVVRYDCIRDVITVSWTKDGDLYHRRQQGAVAYPSSNLTEALEAIGTQVSNLHAPRLF